VPEAPNPPRSSRPDGAALLPALTLRDWLTGTRPVVGAIGACSLMLLACSWFVLGPRELGKSSDVGTPAPVRIAALKSEPSPRGQRTHTEGHAIPTKPRRTSAGVRSPRRAVPRPVTESAPQSHSAAPTAPSPPAAPTPKPASSSSTSPPAPVVPAVTTPALPAPLDDVPEVNVPPVTVQVPPVSVPVLPVTVPAVTVTTPALGLP
jgi:hypothetical protein